MAANLKRDLDIYKNVFGVLDSLSLKGISSLGVYFQFVDRFGEDLPYKNPNIIFNISIMIDEKLLKGDFNGFCYACYDEYNIAHNFRIYHDLTMTDLGRKFFNVIGNNDLWKAVKTDLINKHKYLYESCIDTFPVNAYIESANNITL